MKKQDSSEESDGLIILESVIDNTGRRRAERRASKHMKIIKKAGIPLPLSGDSSSIYDFRDSSTTINSLSSPKRNPKVVIKSRETSNDFSMLKMPVPKVKKPIVVKKKSITSYDVSSSISDDSDLLIYRPDGSTVSANSLFNQSHKETNKKRASNASSGSIEPIKLSYLDYISQDMNRKKSGSFTVDIKNESKGTASFSIEDNSEYKYESKIKNSNDLNKVPVKISTKINAGNKSLNNNETEKKIESNQRNSQKNGKNIDKNANDSFDLKSKSIIDPEPHMISSEPFFQSEVPENDSSSDCIIIKDSASFDRILEPENPNKVNSKVPVSLEHNDSMKQNESSVPKGKKNGGSKIKKQKLSTDFTNKNRGENNKIKKQKISEDVAEIKKLQNNEEVVVPEIKNVCEEVDNKVDFNENIEPVTQVEKVDLNASEQKQKDSLWRFLNIPKMIFSNSSGSEQNLNEQSKNEQNSELPQESITIINKCFDITGKKDDNNLETLPVPESNENVKLKSAIFENEATENLSNKTTPSEKIEEEIIEDPEYRIIFKTENFEKEFIMKQNDTLESIFKSIFGDDLNGKLLLEGLKLSRFLTVKDSGFFPGVNYITVPEECSQSLKNIVKLRFQIGEAQDDALELSFFVFEKVKAINDKLIDILKSDQKFYLSLNGLLISEDSLIGSVLESNDLVDVIRTDKPIFFNQ